MPEYKSGVYSMLTGMLGEQEGHVAASERDGPASKREERDVVKCFHAVYRVVTDSGVSSSTGNAARMLR